MPYIKQEERDRLDPAINSVNVDIKDGALNYTITRICHHWIEAHPFKYFTLARVMGCLICVMFELYRAVIAPYEDRKRTENGGISEYDS